MDNMRPVVVVAGGGSSLGKALTEEFSRRECLVVSASRVESSFNTNNIFWRKLDITDERQCRDLIRNVTKDFSRIDVLINCAGYYPESGSIIEIDFKEIMKDIDVTYKGPVTLSKYFVIENKESGFGRIIFISSNAGVSGSNSDRAVYAANKAAIIRFSEVLDSEIKQYGMRSQVIIPSQLSNETDAGVLKKQKAISYSVMAEIIADTVFYKGNAFVNMLEVKPN